MTRILAAGLLVAGALIGAAPAGADPQDLVPFCSGDQNPVNSNCRYSPDQGFMGSFPGANPDLPLGPNPGMPAAV
jgi:hypothetical protein